MAGSQTKKILYHKYQPTATGWNIESWNIHANDGEVFKLKETIDNRGRVVLLEFLKNGELADNPPCFSANRVYFEYVDGKIIEHLFHFDKALDQNCEMHFKTIYHLNKSNFIFKMERFYKPFDSAKTTLAKTYSDNLEIEYYYHSFAKMNGIYPVNENYKFKGGYYYGDEPEKSSILGAIRH
ncbi:MAG: hypothetical protein JXQ87_02895 [Bacteroidia bacterium]